MRLVAVALSLAWPSAAFAQSFYLQSGTLRVGATVVGRAVRTGVALVGGAGSVAELSHDDAVLSVRASVDLTEGHLQAGVGAPTALGQTAFAVRMLPGTWLPVVEVLPDAVRVALPRGAPATSGVLARGAVGAEGAPAGLPWARAGGQPLDDDEALHCTGFTLSPRSGAAGSWMPPDRFARRRLGTARGWDAIEVDVDGVVVVGYRRVVARCGARPTPAGFGTTGGSGSGDGVSHGRVVILPTGTRLFATPVEATPFATLRANSYGIEPLDHPPGRLCDGRGGCTRMPAPPTGPAMWRVQQQDAGGGQWLLLGQVRAPAESLVEAPPDHGGYGLTSPWAPDWPRR